MPNLEDYLPAVRHFSTINTDKNVDIDGTLNVQGAVTFQGASTGLSNVVSITAATYVPTAAQSGTVFMLNRAGGIAVTLPAPASGLWYKFIIGTNFTTNGTIATNGGANIMNVGINELEVDTNDDGPSDLDADLITFNNALDTVGDHVEMVSDGTSWFVTGQTVLDGCITTSTT